MNIIDLVVSPAFRLKPYCRQDLCGIFSLFSSVAAQKHAMGDFL
jgi:hypothetical protein